ncbi:MAG: PSP1 domain-containing protein [Bacilli bacterium]
MKIVSVAFEGNKKNYFFKVSPHLEVRKGDIVVVNTISGLEIAHLINDEIKQSHIPIQEMKEVVRKASEEDLKQFNDNIEASLEALKKIKEILEDFPTLMMKVVQASYNLDKTKLLFVYISDERVDFRALLKVLANTFRTRIELKQIGSREKAKLVGGIGPCGMETCCTRYLKEFDNISINMAKNQMLALNPLKISGLCGRLLCCLSYENDSYTDAKKLFPKIGIQVEYKDARYRVGGVNIINGEVKLENFQNIIYVKKEEISW